MKMSDFVKKNIGHHFSFMGRDEENPKRVYIVFTDGTEWYLLGDNIDFEKLSNLIYKNYNNPKKISQIMAKNTIKLGKNVVDYKQVKCDACGAVHDARYDQPNNKCPSCGEGNLEIV